MKHFLLSLCALFCASNVMAQLNGNGYYRVRNDKTLRYVYVLDDKGELNVGSSTAEMGAIELWKDVDRAMCDPATVCFIEAKGDKYDIQAQGTGVYEIIDTYVSIRKNSDGTYYAYGSKDGITKYLSDAEQADTDMGNFSDAGKGEYRKWRILPMNTGNDNYLGVLPTVSAGGAFYTSYFTDFPYSAFSSGIQFFYVSKVVAGYAVMKEIKGTVPADTPIFIKVASDKPADNKLNIGGSGAAVKGNLLKGVFFDNTNKVHYNRTPFDAKSMRVLGVMSDGSIGFVTSDIKFIPKNHAYLQVPEGTPAELKLISEDDYNKLEADKPESISLDKTKLTLVEGEKYTLKATVLPESAFDKSVTWVTNNPAIALMDNKGTVTAVKAGVVNVTATTRNGLVASCEVVVKEPTQPESVVLSETKVMMTVGDTHTLKATVLPDNAYDKSVVWGSYDKSLATIDNHGVITAHKAGVVRVFAQSVNGIQSFCEVVISDPVAPQSIVLSESHIKMFIGQKHQLTATVLPEDAHNKKVFWGSMDNKKATIDNHGVILALNEGVVRMRAWSAEDDKVEAYCEVVISKEVKPVDIKLDQTKLDMLTGDKVQLKATILPEDASDKSVTWLSDNEGVASVNAEGVVTAVAAGKAKVTAVSSNGLKANCFVSVKDPIVKAESIVLDKSEYEALEGSEFQLKATVLPEKTTNKVVAWHSDNVAVATVNGEGLVKALKAGMANISAKTTDGTELSASCVVTVKLAEVPAQSISLDKHSYEAEEGSEFTLVATILPENATIRTAAWSSSDSDIASVNEGVVKVLKEGTATITAVTKDGTDLKDECIVTVLSGIEEIFADVDSFPVKIFSADGVLVKTAFSADDFKGLVPGMYIIGGRKFFLVK